MDKQDRRRFYKCAKMDLHVSDCQYYGVGYYTYYSSGLGLG